MKECNNSFDNIMFNHSEKDSLCEDGVSLTILNMATMCAYVTPIMNNPYRPHTNCSYFYEAMLTNENDIELHIYYRRRCSKNICVCDVCWLENNKTCNIDCHINGTAPEIIFANITIPADCVMAATLTVNCTFLNSTISSTQVQAKINIMPSRSESGTCASSTVSPATPVVSQTITPTNASGIIISVNTCMQKRHCEYYPRQ